MVYIPGIERLVYNSITNPAGNTIAATATETSFASMCPIPAGTMSKGELYEIYFAGHYSTPGLTPPTTIAKIKLSPTGSATPVNNTAAAGVTPNGAVTILATPALSNPAGSNALGYSGFAYITVLSTGVAGTVESSGLLTFNSSATASVSLNVPATITTVNTTILNYLQLAALFSNNNAMNSNTLDMLVVKSMKPVAASY